MRNTLYEQALLRQGVQWSYREKVPLEEIDLQKGLRNQARLGEPLDEGLVEEYAALYKAHSEPPPLVLWRPGRGRYVPLDGNQRLAACRKSGRTWHDAYVVQTSDEQVVNRLAWTINQNVHGKRLSYEECLQHAITFVRKYGMGAPQAASEWGVKKWEVQKAVRAAELKDVLRSNGVPLTASLSDDKLNVLGPLEAVGEDVFSKAAAAVAGSGVGAEDTKELVARVRAARSHGEKLKAVEDFASSEKVQNRRAQTKGGTTLPRVDPRTRFERWLREGERLLSQYKARGALLPPGGDRLREVREVMVEVVDRLVELGGLGALPGRKGASA